MTRTPTTTDAGIRAAIDAVQDLIHRAEHASRGGYCLPTFPEYAHGFSRGYRHALTDVLARLTELENA